MKNTARVGRILLLVGVALGFYGGMALNLTWLIAPFVGFALMRGVDSMPRRYVFTIYPKWITALIVSTGIILGGLPVWGTIAGMWITSMEKFSCLPILQIFVTATLFFLGAVAQISYCWRQEKMGANN